MSTNISLRWNNGGKQRRAAQIPMEVWENHKPIIRELYRDKTLAELVEVMKTDYGIDATARQYTWKLSQWGLHKQGAGKEQDKNSIVVSTAGFGVRQCEKSLAEPYGQRLENLKRPNSRQTNGSGSSQYSLDSTPTSKRLKTTSKEDIDGTSPSWNGGNFSETSHMTSPEESQSFVSSTSSDEAIVAKDDSPTGSGSQHGGSPQSPHSKNCTVSSERVNEGVEPEACLQSGLTMSTPRLESYVAQLMERRSASRERSTSPDHPNRPGSFIQSVNLDFCLNISRSLEGFLDLSDGFDLPKQAEDRLKVVADRLFAVDQFEAASNIYSVLLVAEESETRQRTRSHTQGVPMLTSRVIAAFRSAMAVPQLDLVQHVLLKRMEMDHNQEGSASELFLVHQVLADCFGRQGFASKRLYHLKQSWKIAHRLNEEGDPRLTLDHSVLFYIYYKSAFPELPSSKYLDVNKFKDASSRPGRVAAHGTTPVAYDDFIIFRELVRNLAQGEKSAHRHENISNCRILMCVRDCVAWCGSIRKHIHRKIYPFQRFQAVWDAWQGERTALQQQPQWATVLESELGISIAEHLFICAHILSMIGGAKGLSVIPDRQLVDLHFELLFDRVSINPGRQSSSQGLRNSPSRISLAPTIASSLGSSNSSLREFRSMSQSIQQRVVGVSSIRSLRSHDSGSLSAISQLSELFKRNSIREEDATEASHLTLGESSMVEGECL